MDNSYGWILAGIPSFTTEVLQLLRLEGTLGWGHLVQPLAKNRSTLKSDQFAPALSSWTLKTPSTLILQPLWTTSLCLIIFTLIYFYYLFFPLCILGNFPLMLKDYYYVPSPQCRWDLVSPRCRTFFFSAFHEFPLSLFLLSL